MTTKQHRKAIPLGVKLHACLLLLGFTDEEIVGGVDFDHQPALAFREVVDGVMMPASNDPHYLRPMRRAEHRIKTSGTKATSAGSDVHMAARVKRLNGEKPRKPKGKPLPGTKKSGWKRPMRGKASKRMKV